MGPRLWEPFAVGAGRLWLHRLRYPWSKVYRPLVERRYRGMPLPEPSTIDEVRSVLTEMTWAPDGPRHLFDAISRPEAVWANRRDDCDGYAILAATLLARIDPRTAPLLVTTVVLPLKQSHTVCAFRDREKGGFRVFDNARLVDQRFAMLEEVAAHVARRGRRLICWDAVRPADLRQLSYGRT